MAATAIRLVFGLVCFFRATADLCLQSMPEYSDQRNGNSAAHFRGKTQAIIPDYSFTCSGNVTRWGAYVEPGGSSEEYHVNFQVWRPSHLAGCYALVGNNRLQRATPADNQITLEVPEEEQIQVQPRDVMGFYIQHLGGRSGGIQLLASVGADSVSVWHAGEIMSTDTGTCRLSVGEGGTLSSMIDRKPVVTAVVRQKSPTNTPLSSSTATFATLPADPTEMADTAVTSAVFLVLGAIIGCTVTVITAVAIAIYVTRQKRAREAEDNSQGYSNDLIAIDNVSYAPQKICPGQNGGLPIPTARNEAYGAVLSVTESGSYEYPQPSPQWRALRYEVPMPIADRVGTAVRKDHDLSNDHYEFCEVGDYEIVS